MNYWIKTSALMIAGAFAASCVAAQDGQDKAVKKTEKKQEIVIRQSGDKKKKPLL